MKKALIKLFIQLLLLLILAGLAFAFGYLQFAVPIGKYGVMVSKTSGYYENIITHDDVIWKWERLIPTNSTIMLFNLLPIKIEKTITGELENAEKYKKMLKNTPNFSWKAELSLRLYIVKENLIGVLKKTNIQSEEELEAHIKEEMDHILKSIIEESIFLYQNNKDKNYNIESFKEECNKKLRQKLPSLLKCHFFSIQFSPPDFVAYQVGKETYDEYISVKRDIIEEKVEKLRALQKTLQELSQSVEKATLDFSDGY